MPPRRAPRREISDAGENVFVNDVMPSRSKVVRCASPRESQKFSFGLPCAVESPRVPGIRSMPTPCRVFLLPSACLGTSLFFFVAHTPPPLPVRLPLFAGADVDTEAQEPDRQVVATSARIREIGMRARYAQSQDAVAHAADVAASRSPTFMQFLHRQRFPFIAAAVERSQGRFHTARPRFRFAPPNGKDRVRSPLVTLQASRHATQRSACQQPSARLSTMPI